MVPDVARWGEDAVHFLKLYWKELAGTCGGIAAATKAYGPWIQTVGQGWRNHRSLKYRPGADLYTQQDLVKATKYYLEPYCQSIDPAGLEDFRKTVAPKQLAHTVLSESLNATTGYKFIIILADSGMGKTTLLLNYYIKFGRNRNGPSSIVIIPLNHSGADREIEKVQEQSDKVLFLDAFDEDARARSNHRARLKELLDLCRGFRCVVITCRTQFFERDSEIPVNAVGVFRSGTVRASEQRGYDFYKLYLSPFSSEQVDEYLRMRFGPLQRRVRRRAKEIVDKASDLTARPMLLSHVPDLLNRNVTYSQSTQVYGSMIDAWLDREEPEVSKTALLKFSEELAVNMCADKLNDKSEKIPSATAVHLAAGLGIQVESWALTGRSLLNRDVEGRLKFAHRSIMEYLYISSFLKDPRAARSNAWTDQMKWFWWEMLQASFSKGVYESTANLALEASEFGDISGLYDLKVAPLVRLRSIGGLPVYSNMVKFQAYPFFRKRYPGIYESGMLEGDKAAVVDYATGLMWQGQCVIVDLSGATEYAHYLNRIAYGGFSGWRLPTLDEVLSLSPDHAGGVGSGKSYPSGLPVGYFQDWFPSMMTSDTFQTREPIAYDFTKGTIYPLSNEDVRTGAARVRYVRTA